MSGFNENRKERSFYMLNPCGLHARPAAMLVKKAGQFKSDVLLEKDGICVDGKSLLKVLTLGVMMDEQVTVITQGEDAAEALDQLGDLFQCGFGEDDPDSCQAVS